MADEKDNPVEQDLETIKPAGGKTEELPEKDLDSVSGGIWIDIHKT
jgi:bacteriocin-like protein